MNIKPIRTERDLDRAFKRLDAIFGAKAGTAEADEAQVLEILIEDYENRRHPILPPDPIAAIRFRMEQQGLAPKDLEHYIGPRSRVSEVLNRRRSLTIAMIRRLHKGLHIPLESLIAPAARRAA